MLFSGSVEKVISFVSVVSVLFSISISVDAISVVSVVSVLFSIAISADVNGRFHQGKK